MLGLADPLDSLEPGAILARIALSAALGFLVGLQRERAQSGLAGIRTFPLITTWGTIAAILSIRFGVAILATAAAALAAVMVFENLSRRRTEHSGSGITTETAALVMFGIGVLLVVAAPIAAVVVTGGVAFLLQQKGPLHRMAGAIGDADFRAVMQFVLITLVILPVLPDRPFGPHDTLNPFRIWLIVVLVVGLELAGFVAFKSFGKRAGVFLAGVLGGLVSSTATTMSYARRSRETSRSAAFAEIVIVLAAAVAFGRLLVAVAIVAPGIVPTVGPPLAVAFAAMLAIAAALTFLVDDGEVELPEARNPAALVPALLFGAVYAVVTLASAFAQATFGSGALYGVAVVAGLADLNAITLSTATLAAGGAIDPGLAWRVILVAAIANLAFKLAVVGVVSPKLAPRIALAFSASGVVALALVGLWP